MLTVCLTTAGLDLLAPAMPGAPRWVEAVVVAATTAVATAVKFLALKLWVFAPTSVRPGAVAGRAAQSSTTAKDALGVLEHDDAGPLEAVDLAARQGGALSSPTTSPRSDS